MDSLRDEGMKKSFGLQEHSTGLQDGDILGYGEYRFCSRGSIAIRPKGGLKGDEVSYRLVGIEERVSIK